MKSMIQNRFQRLLTSWRSQPSRSRNVRIERTRRAAIGLFSIFVLANIACQRPDPVAAFISKQDALPPEERVPDWDRTKRLMLRKAPAVGDVAPDFSLVTLDGSSTLKMSELHASRPLVLVFGSFT